jgi:Icc-related predicted phosphoesterase
LKLVLLSDTHGRHRHFTTPPGDILIHAGDIMTNGYRKEEIVDFNDWLGEQPQAKKVVIAGNHDRLFESTTSAQGVLTNAIYLENSGVTIAGLKFWGSPASPEFCNWAFNYRRGAHINRIWQQIPDDTDVLITHGPPAGIQDWVKPKTASLGCRDLLHAVIRVKPKLHVFGHIHGGYGEWQGTTTHFVNASLLDERYRPVNQPIVVDLSI